MASGKRKRADAPAAMPVTNAALAQRLEERADELAAGGANMYRVRAYRRAAQNVAKSPRAVADMLAKGEDLRQIPGVGEDLAAKLRALVESGGAALPPPTERPDKPSKRAKEEGRRSRGHLPADAPRIRPLVESLAERIRQGLADAPGVARAELAGGFRRRSDTVRDLDFVLQGDEAAVRAALAGLPDVAEVTGAKDGVVTARLTKGMLVDVHLATTEAFGAAWLLATGTPAHGEALRARAKARKLRLGPDGLWSGRRRVAGASEEDSFAALGLAPIPPELREGDAEVKAAAAGTLPDLVQQADLKGDLHTHTTDSDGAHSLEAMARAAQRKGLSYMAVTDHTSRTAVAGGMKWPAFQRQHKAIDRLNAKLDDEGIPFRVLKGAEVDILKDGRLDLEPGQLEQLDIVVASLHFREQHPPELLTARVLKAMGTGKAHVLGHPGGRLLGKRPAIEHDWEVLLHAAKDQGWAFEVDGSPWRQDAWGALVRQGQRLGVRFALDSDAHATSELAYQRFAVEQGRRGWLAAKDVLNTRDADALLKLLR